MCGIVGAATRRNVAGILLEGLQRLEYRGYDSAGLSIIDASGQIQRLRRVGKVQALASAWQAAPVDGQLGISHTRWATHGKPTEDNAHPHHSSNDVAVVHNGIIENHEPLRIALVAAGYIFSSDTDTEVIAHLVHQEVASCGDFRLGVVQALAKLKGAYAVAVIHKDYPSSIMAARVGSPLVVGLGIGENYVASDPQALRPVTDRFIFLDEGEMVEVQADGIIFHGTNTATVAQRTVQIDTRIDATDKGTHRHYMTKEIYEQPETVAATLEGRVTAKHVLESAFGVNAGAVFAKTQAIQIVACGSSYYTGLVARYWFEEIAGIPCSVEVASEFRYRQVAVIPGTLLVTISQSGETADTLAALRNATNSNYVASLCLCNVADSSLVRESDLCLLIHAGPEICVASTKAFTAQLADLLMLVIVIAKYHGLDDAAEQKLVTALLSVPAQIHRALALDDAIKVVARQFVDKQHALFLGRGPHYPVAMEGALKLKEISYIHAEGYPSGELKHGPLALVDASMPVVAVAPTDELLDKLKSNLQEVKARGGQLIVFGDSDRFVDEDGTTLVHMPHCDPVIAPIIYTIPMQLLAYHVAVAKGTDVDQPRNLAKSVTVE
ncbi:MAG: glutamine--fructose-6-phosphate transaminase (isomerizing) [SAR86 cluster bacterium]|jgi:glutamine---fructose-6-phosphate transaminase (isomerizing)|uniref:Glutamine--fructose-6-phosphate aminotransferase [isomerizing] n=1 Tax=SAR86 cluster bacterium TaxID=2030880 RepID=A0A972VWY2_9GAMM|nr:glutamine--fructose-6-phosphate transaminase (isomerizing) [SAR86 cluster bacterium]|tara:strand:+ start:16389 stop:18218 length:1830 start_codon:yes stop_codon:yes gene_type:complete